MAVVRGDHEVNPVRLARALGVDEVFLAARGRRREGDGREGRLRGPVGFKGRVVVDRAAARVRNGATGANETDYHFTGVHFGRDYQGGRRRHPPGDDGRPVPRAATAGKLTQYRGIEAGHIFILGTKYSAAMGATFIDEQQQTQPLVMGCYGIGVSRLVATTIEQHHDDNGIRWPMSVAPYHVHLVHHRQGRAVARRGEGALRRPRGAGRRGALGRPRRAARGEVQGRGPHRHPLRVTFGGKGFAAGNVEVKPRTEPDPKKAEAVPLAGALDRIAQLARP